MEKKKAGNNPMPILASLVVMYVVSAILLFVLSFLLGKIEMSDQIVRISIIFVYIISCFVGGWLIGKKMKRQQYLWGLGVGVLYFLVLLVGNLAVNRGFSGMEFSLAATAVICIASATAGGMVS